MTADEYQARLDEIEAEYEKDLEEYRSYWAGEWSVPGVFYVPLGPEQAKAKRDRARAEAREERIRQLELLKLERAAASGADEDGPAATETPKAHRGAKSRWRRADLETIFVRHPEKSPRALVDDADLIETVHFQRIYEVRRRGDIGVDERGRLALPEGTTADGGWVTLPRKP